MKISLPDDSIGTGAMPESDSFASFESFELQEEVKPQNFEGIRRTPIEERWKHELAVCERAMDSKNGIAVPCPNAKAALALRMQFYRMRREWRKLFPDSYSDTWDTLVFTAEGSRVLIKKRREFGEGYKIEEL